MNVAAHTRGVADDLAGITNPIRFTIIIGRSGQTTEIEIVGAGSAEERRVQASVIGRKRITDHLAGCIDRVGGAA